MVIGAAVLLFIASFLNSYSVEGFSVDSNAWDSLGMGLGIYMGGVIGGALIVVNRSLPQPRKVLGLDLGTVGAAFTVLTAWSMFWALVDVPERASAAAGLILGFIAALLLAAGAIATPSSPRSRPPSSRPPAPPPRSPTVPSPRWLRLPGCPAAAAAVRWAAAGRAAVRGWAAAGAAGSGRGLLAVLVRRARAAPAVRGGRLADPDRRTRAGHLVPGRRAAWRHPGRADAGRPPWRAPGHLGYSARLSP